MIVCPFTFQLHPSYQIIFDNVNILKKVRHKTTSHQNKQHNLVQAYSVLDRVCCEDLPNESPILSDIKNLPSSTWWLPEDEEAAIKEEIKVSNMDLWTVFFLPFFFLMLHYILSLVCIVPVYPSLHWPIIDQVLR